MPSNSARARSAVEVRPNSLTSFFIGVRASECAFSAFTSSFVHGRRWCLMSFFGAVTEAPSYVTPNGKWLPGKSGNPAGRPQGSRQKISNQLLADLESVWAQHGKAVLQRLAVDDPAKLATIAFGYCRRTCSSASSRRHPAISNLKHGQHCAACSTSSRRRRWRVIQLGSSRKSRPHCAPTPQH